MSDLENEQELKREEILVMRELTAELKGMRFEIQKFNLFISSISQKAGQLGAVKSLIDMFMNTGKKDAKTK